MGKFKMPTETQFLEKKRIYDEKKDPVWVYLEKEMREHIEKKPYNEKVGAWLKFMKELKYYYFCEVQTWDIFVMKACHKFDKAGYRPPFAFAILLCPDPATRTARRKARRLNKEVGPAWYYELSSGQREVLKSLKDVIHQDLIEDLPIRMRKSLSDLGLTLAISNDILMDAMKESVEDPGVFVWNLYTSYYRVPPSRSRNAYDLNAKILMSSIVFIDIDECIKSLAELTKKIPRPPPPPKKEPKKYFQPKVRYGEYLQKIYVPCVYHSDIPKPKKPMPLESKIKLRSEKSYEDLRKNLNFLEKRKERNKKEKQDERVCHYKFWEPPSTLRNTDPKMAAYVFKLKMYKNKARPRFLKYKAPYDNVQFQLGNVSFTGGHPRFILNSIVMLQTGYIPINGGIVKYKGEYVTHILGFWKFPRDVHEACDLTCDCLAKWDESVMEFMHQAQCKCGHLYDYYHDGKTVATETYFYPPTKHGPMWFDKAKVFQLDPMEDFIKDTCRDALLSTEPTPVHSMPTIAASGLKEKELLASFLADLADSPLMIPHLPEANLLNNLQEWVRQSIKGNITPCHHKKLMLKSQRRWLDLKHMDFRARAFRIPFTNKQLDHITWSHRGLVQKLFDVLLNNFVTRNRKKQVEQTCLWWSTMKYDAYPSKAFLDIFFTYMPARIKDTFLVNPYSSECTPKFGGKTCSLNIN